MQHALRITPPLVAGLLAACSHTPPAPGNRGSPPRWLSVSGIYPHLATFNDGSDERYGECGIGAVVPWAGSLWYLTYPPHKRSGSADRLYQLTPDLNVTERAESVGGTHANRMIHRESKQLIMGPYLIDATGKVRAIDVKSVTGRFTAVARHLSAPAEKVYLFDMEGPIWELDVRSLVTKRLFVKPVPGWHGKGAYTGQGRLIVANNGESAPNDQDGMRGVPWELPTEQWSRGPEDAGVLAEYDGQTWTIVSRRQHTDVTGPGDIHGERKAADPVWSAGWDKRSVLLHVRHGAGWSRYRVPKGSYTYDPRHGYFTEWPRIREIGEGRYLMNMHGTFFDFPGDFQPGRTAGLRPISTHLAYLPDFTLWNDRLVLAGDDASIQQNPLAGLSQSNLRFVAPEALASDFGPPVGWGGVWARDSVAANTPSDPLLIAGYAWRTLHLAHEAPNAVTFVLETDPSGDGAFSEWRRVVVPARGYVPVEIPAEVSAPWLRVRMDKDATATAYLHAGTPARANGAMWSGLAPVAGGKASTGGLLRPAPFSRNLQLLARPVAADGSAGPEAYFEVDETLTLRPVKAPEIAAAMRQEAALASDFQVDAASVVVQSADGQRWRLPKGPSAFDRSAGNLRGLREVTSERYLANFHGTFYEVPRGPGKAKPDYARMKPIASHAARITDFASWRGMLVVAGVASEAQADGHVFRSADAQAALWFGAVDDLYGLGQPIGAGGPWRETPVSANTPSDPYLMTGYGKKALTLAHDAAEAVTFTVEVDPLADGTWLTYRTITVPPGKPAQHTFPTAYAAHWVRFMADKACRATATLLYE